MKTAILIAAASGALALQLSTAHARIGETEAQLAARYGKPVRVMKAPGESEPLGAVYHFHGFEITVMLAESRSQVETYKKLDGSEIHRVEVDYLAKANVADSPCGQLEKAGESEVGYNCGDFVVIYHIAKRSLDIALKSGVDKATAKVDAALQSKTREELTGF